MSKSTYANRGMKLEGLINAANKQYKLLHIADVRKVPTPFKARGYMQGKQFGNFEKGEWVDYCGVFNTRSIVFDAKETKGKSLPLKNISEHQLELLDSWSSFGSECFLIVSFSELGKVYRLSYKSILECLERRKKDGRKSIPLKDFEELAYEISMLDGIGLNYLGGL